MTVKEKVHYVLTLPAEHKLWFFFSIISSLLTWFTIRFLNAKYLHVFMGHPAGNIMLCTVSSQQQSLKSWRIARVVEAVCRGVPWECKCLTEAICTNILLRFYRIPSVFYLGSMIEKKSPKMLKAHAWLTVGEYCIIGGEVANNGYIVTATFTHPKILNNRET
ncbi:MAG: lasso peptide biosynthesis B2 protein [Arenicella sp.]